MKRGIVVATHPEDHSVDLVMSDGRRMVGVQVMTSNGSTRSGVFDMPAVPTKKNKWDISKPTGQDQIAIVDFVDGLPIVVGFLFPQVSQMTLNDPKTRMTRHQSDVITMLDGNGNYQRLHPSGAAMIIGESIIRSIIKEKNTDKNLKVDVNLNRQVNIFFGTKEDASSLKLLFTGNAILHGDMLAQMDSTHVKLDAKLDVTIKGARTVKIIAPKIELQATNEITMTAPTITMNATTVNVPTGDVVASTVSLVNHLHSGVIPGTGDTEKPIPSA
jgi:hypothetical protein